MATAHMNPQAVAASGTRQVPRQNARPGTRTTTRQGDPHGSTKQDHKGSPVRTAVRGVGVFLDTAWRVVLLGGEGIDGVKR
ncbi:hypothetical protein ABIA33_000907 [Streptacidiphilus sp. MAP12-16]|jgi:hypothetical protein|uniref:hypothetical protein n=1 Tax=Streptacidiphilus sp. MAP12-16 TaxID=3156300 RepID=UPI003519C417